MNALSVLSCKFKSLYNRLVIFVISIGYQVLPDGALGRLPGDERC